MPSGPPDYESSRAAARGPEGAGDYVSEDPLYGYTRGPKRGFFTGMVENRVRGGEWQSPEEYRYYPRTKRTYRVEGRRATELRAGRRSSRK